MTSYARRRDAARAQLAALDANALLVTDLTNIRYLTGFTGSNAALLVGADGTDQVCTDGRYTEQIRSQVPDLEAIIDRSSARALAARATGVLGYESHLVSVDDFAALSEVSPAKLVSAGTLVECLRTVKDASEIDAIAAACAVADQAFADLIGADGIRPGRTEREVSLDLDQRMRELGASDPSFDTIVATGPNSAIPHHQPSQAVLAAGDFVKLDFGAMVDGYASDMTRTVILGQAQTWQHEIYHLVLAAQEAGRRAVAVGVSGKQVDAAARKVIEDAGYGECFEHGLGHGVGLQVHEAPSVSTGSADILSADMCITIEPGVYLPGRGGVRIEDTGVVGQDGYRVLTATSKDLVSL